MTLLHVVATRQAAEYQFTRECASAALSGGGVHLRPDRRQFTDGSGLVQEWMSVGELHLLAGRSITDWDMDDGVVLTPNQLRLLRSCKLRPVG